MPNAACTCAFGVLSLFVAVSQAATNPIERVDPVIFEIEANARYAGTDLRRWQTFTRDGVQLSQKVRMEFVDANRRVRMEGVHPLESELGIYLGNQPSAWIRHAKGFGGVAYRSLYRGVDVEYRMTPGGLKGDFIVHPEGDVSAIRFRYVGTEVYLDKDHLKSVDGTAMEERIPAVYEIGADGKKTPSQAHYRRFGDGSFGFLCDKQVALNASLVIDPDLIFSTYVAGTQLEQVTAVAYSPDGSLLAAGWTESPDLLGQSYWTAGTAHSTDAFFLRLSVTPLGAVSIGKLLVFGGSGADRANAIAVNSTEIVVAGTTGSVDLPIITPTYQSALKGTSDGFLIRIALTGTTPTMSTYFGGTGTEQITGVATDDTHAIYFAGTTTSSNLPVKNAAQASYGGGLTDGFVAALTSSMTLSYSTYIGGGRSDSIQALALRNFEVYLAGATDSTDFPVLNAYQSSVGGGQDAFVTKLTSAGAISYSTYLGGFNGTPGFPEMANAIAVDSSGQAFVGGMTSSTNFPQLNAAQTTFGGGYVDGFLAKFNATGSLLFSTLWGGSDWDQINGVALMPTGAIVVAGTTSSWDMPTLRTAQKTILGSYDVFLSEFKADGSIYWSTFWGGTSSDTALALCSNVNSEILFGGNTSSFDLPILNPVQGSVASTGYHGFIARYGVPSVTGSNRTLPSQIGVYRPNPLGQASWLRDLNYTYSPAPTNPAWGSYGDVPIAGDWDNTGTFRVGVFSSVFGQTAISGRWWLDINNDYNWTTFAAGDRLFQFGSFGDKPVIGDLDNTGKTRIGVFSQGTWYLALHDGYESYLPDHPDIWFQFGADGDWPVVGDWDNTGRVRIGVFRRGTWYLDFNGDRNFANARQFTFGQTGDWPVVGDWDNTGRLRIGVFRDGLWLLDMNGDFQYTPNVDKQFTFGQPGDKPIVIPKWPSIAGQLTGGSGTPGFTLNASSASASTGSIGTSTISVLPYNGFNSPVTLSAGANWPAGFIPTFSVNPINLSSVMTVSVPANASAGIFALPVVGTGATAATATVPIPITVTAAPGFSLAATSLSAIIGQTGTATITISRFNQFNSPVTLSATNLPAGVTASFAVNPASTTTAVSLTVASTVAAGTYSVTFGGVSGSLSATATMSLIVSAPPGFTVSAPPTSISAGFTGTAAVTIAAKNGFVSTVIMATSNWPAGISGTFSPNPGSTSSLLSITVGASVASGTYPLLIKGAGGSAAASTTLLLTVSAGSSFALTASNVTVAQGGAGASSIFIFPSNGFNAAVNLTATGWPTGVTGAFSMNPATSSSTLIVRSLPGIATGSSVVTVTGTSGPLTVSTSFTLNVTQPPQPNFSLSAANATATIAVNGISSVQVSPVNGFVGTVNFSQGPGWPTGINASFAPASSSTGTTMTITVSSSVPFQTFSLGITGTSGTISNTANFQLTVNQAPTFTISALPVTVPSGGGVASAVTVTPLAGFNSPVSLTTSGWPAGMSANFTLNPVPGTPWTSLIVVNLTSAVSPGTYTLPITGTTESLTINGSITVTASGTINNGGLPYGVPKSPSQVDATVGTAQLLDFIGAGPAGTTPLDYVWFLIQDSAVPTPTLTNACYMRMWHVGNGIGYLFDDQGNQISVNPDWLGSPDGIVEENSQCLVNGYILSGTRVRMSPDGLLFEALLSTTFKAPWQGKTLTVYMSGSNAAGTGNWYQVGTIKVH